MGRGGGPLPSSSLSFSRVEEALAFTVRASFYFWATLMQPGMRNRLRIAVLIYSMTNAVIFGVGIITVLNVPALSTNAYFWIPVVVVSKPYSGRAFRVANRTASASTLQSVVLKHLAGSKLLRHATVKAFAQPKG